MPRQDGERHSAEVIIPGMGFQRRVRFGRFLLAIGLFAALWLGAGSGSRADGIVRGFYFYSPDCPHCPAVAEEVLPGVQERFGAQLELRMFDIRAPENMELLLALEQQHDVKEVGLPEAFIGTDVLVGEEGVRDGLEATIQKYLDAGGTQFPADNLPVPYVEPTPAAPVAESVVNLAYFFKPGCSECDRADLDIAQIVTRYPAVKVTRFDGTTEQPLSWALGKRAGLAVSRRMVTPAVFVGNEALVGDEVTFANLESLIQRHLASGAPAVWEGLSTTDAQGEIVGFFRSLGPLAVIGAGLVDGINPCAFATVVFFISYLSFLGRSRRDMLLVGGAFTLGVFAAYMLAGIGAMRFLEAISGVRLLGKLVLGLMGALCVLFAAVAAHDAWQARKGNVEAMRMRLPKALQLRIHRVIRDKSSQPAFVGAALVTGLIVSLLELACTGQVYLPTLVYIQSDTQLRASGLTYLLLYNAMFVLPLVVVFVVAALGTSSTRLAALVQRHTGTVKLLTAGLFLVLGCYLLSTVL